MLALLICGECRSTRAQPLFNSCIYTPPTEGSARRHSPPEARHSPTPQPLQGWAAHATRARTQRGCCGVPGVGAAAVVVRDGCAGPGDGACVLATAIVTAARCLLVQTGPGKPLLLRAQCASRHRQLQPIPCQQAPPGKGARGALCSHPRSWRAADRVHERRRARGAHVHTPHTGKLNSAHGAAMCCQGRARHASRQLGTEAAHGCALARCARARSTHSVHSTTTTKRKKAGSRGVQQQHS
jgi:hypothetical protein